MSGIFENYTGARVLEFFIFNPTTEFHIKDLARRLKISSSTSKYYCDLFNKEGILKVVNKGNLRLFSLDSNDFLAKHLKKTFALLKIKELGLERASKEGSVAVYGSFASGEFDENSDLDVLIIGKEEEVEKDFILKIGQKLGREIQLTVLPYYKWEKMKQKKEVFVLEVLKNHVLLKGEGL